MKAIAFLAVALLLFILLVPAVSARAQTESPIDAFHAAFNAYDVPALQALVTDDFVLEVIYPSIPENNVRLEGKAGVADLIGGVSQDNFKLQASDVVTTGDTITFDYTGDSDLIQTLGIGLEFGTGEAHLENGKFKSIAYTVDPEWALKQRDAEAAQAAALPTTGGARSPLAYFAFGLTGLVLAALGLSIWRRTSPTRS